MRKWTSFAPARLRICTVIGFPNGYSTTSVKCFETTDAVKNGADEIDMVMSIGMFKSGEYDYVRDEIAAVKKAVGKNILKVIIETCLLTEDEIVKASLLVKEAGADFVKTSTGFSIGGAKAADIGLIRKTVGPDMGIKASGGIRTYDDALAMIDAGADRIGASASVGICCNEKE